jgi:hypothetical protein
MFSYLNIIHKIPFEAKRIRCISNAVPFHPHAHHDSARVSHNLHQIATLLFTSMNLILHGVISSFPHLWFKIEIHQFPLLRRPFTIRITVKYNLITPSVPHFDRCMTDSSLCLPLNRITGALCNQEGFAAADIIV